jgi:hypothetical protein
MRIDVETERYPCLPSPEVPRKLCDREDIKTVKPEVSVLASADVVGE